MFLGVFQGIILSAFLIFKKAPDIEANRYQGFLLLSLSLCILEQFLNMTGLIVRVLHVTNTTEPLNLVIGPFLYLFVSRSIDRNGSKREWFHFLVAILYFCYMCLDYAQPDEFKYNSYIYSYHPDWPALDIKTTLPDDPLNIKQHLNLFTALQILFYIILSLLLINRKASQNGESLVRIKDETLRSLRNMVLHILAIALIFILVKSTFKADLGDYFVGIYVSVFALITSLRVMNDSSYFERSATFMDITTGKYRKSSLTEQGKEKILGDIINELKVKNYYAGNMASLTNLAKRLGESPHHVSQVINEKLGKNFFELLAQYRIEKAKMILGEDEENKLTIEEISEMVGYNSKTAFNNAFRKLTGKTPSEYRNQPNS